MQLKSALIPLACASLIASCGGGSPPVDDTDAGPPPVRIWRTETSHTLTARASGAGLRESAEVAVSVRKGSNQDVNGDGYADIVVSGHPPQGAAGQVHVFYSRGRAGVASGSARDAGTILAGEEPSQYGHAVALGDLDADGYADVLVTAPGYRDAGRAYVYLSAGLVGIPTGSPPSAVIDGDPAGGRLGGAITLADIDGDGDDDTVVGGTDRASIFLSRPGQLGARSVADVVLTVATGSSFGSSLAAGDLTGDGRADLVVGAGLGNTAFGFVYIFHAEHLTNPFRSADLADTVHSDLVVNSGFGLTLAAGDVTGDGLADVLVGAPITGGLAGKAYLFHSAGDAGIPAAALPSAVLEGLAFGEMGWSLAIGDTNGDGFGDIVTGSVGGRTHAFHSRGAAGIANATTAAAETVLVHDGTRFGTSVAVADVNGDAHGDIVVGDPSAFDTGAVHVFHAAAAVGVQSQSPASGNAVLRGELDSQFGHGVAGTSGAQP